MFYKTSAVAGEVVFIGEEKIICSKCGTRTSCILNYHNLYKDYGDHLIYSKDIICKKDSCGYMCKVIASDKEIIPDLMKRSDEINRNIVESIAEFRNEWRNRYIEVRRDFLLELPRILIYVATLVALAMIPIFYIVFRISENIRLSIYLAILAGLVAFDLIPFLYKRFQGSRILWLYRKGWIKIVAHSIRVLLFVSSTIMILVEVTPPVFREISEPVIWAIMTSFFIEALINATKEK